MGDWPFAPLADLVEADSPITYGVVKPGDDPPDGVPFIRGGDIAGGHIDRTALRRISSDVSAQYRRTLLRGGELVVSLVGNPGQVAVVPDDLAGANIARQVGLVRLGPAVDTQFIKYFLLSPKGQEALGAHALGSVQQVINLRDLKTVQVPLPHIDEQRSIASTLGALDDKIEQNRLAARTLERLARAIFRAWFVDFEPVRAKADGSASFPSMPQHIFEALPTRLVDSEIGPVPEGWQVRPMGECTHLTMGQSPPSEYYNEAGDGLPFHQGVSDYGFRFPNHRVYCTVEGRMAESRDVLLSVRAPVGRINVADRRLVLGRGLAGVRHARNLQSFLLHHLAHVFAEEDAFGDGTIYKAVTKQFLLGMPMLSPQPDVQDAFETTARALDDLVASCEVESRKLGEMRDYLLPKLLSGTVRMEVVGG